MFRSLLGPLWALVPKGTFFQVCAEAHGYLDHYIDQALAKPDSLKSRSLIQGLASQTNDQIFIRSQVIQAMMAAQDTTSELLTNALFLLARNPKHWAELRAKFVNKSESELSAESLVKCSILGNILRESKHIRSPLTHLPAAKPFNLQPCVCTQFLRSWAVSPCVTLHSHLEEALITINPCSYQRDHRSSCPTMRFIATRMCLAQRWKNSGPSAGQPSARRSGNMQLSAVATGLASGRQRLSSRPHTYLLGSPRSSRSWRAETSGHGKVS